MIITVNSGGGNLGNYLVNGRGGKRDKSKTAILDGDFKLSQEISNSSKYKDKHFHFILSTKEKLSNEKMENIYLDFKKELLDAYNEDEINISAILHQDTDHSHVHVMIPKMNMLTNRKLDLYYHKRDKKRFSLITNYLDEKYNLQPATLKMDKNKKLNSQIKNWKPNTSIIKNKKDKLEFEKLLVKHINDSKNLIYSNHDELILHLKNDLKLNITKVGYDYKEDDFYITIQNENSKQRVFHPFFNNDKLKYTTNTNGEKIYEQLDIQSATANYKHPKQCEQGIKSIRGQLDKENQKYRDRIEKRTGTARKKAQQGYIQNQDSLYCSSDINNIHESINNTISKNSNKIRKNRDYSKTNTKLLNTNYLYINNVLHEKLEQLNKTNPTQIATKLLNYKLTKSDEKYNIISDKSTNSNHIIYKTAKGVYNFLNPLTKQIDNTSEFILKKLGVLKPTIWIFKEIFKLMDEITEVLSLISDILLESLIKNISENKFIKNDKLSLKTKKIKPKELDNSPHCVLDLKPH